MNARKVSGSDRSWYGMYFVEGRGTSEVRYHSFFVSGLGTYTYEIKTMDAPETSRLDLEIVQRSTVGTSIEPGDSTNVLRLTRRGSILEFRVNGQAVLEVATKLEKNEDVQVGIAVHPERNLPPGDHIEAAFSDWKFFRME